MNTKKICKIATMAVLFVAIISFWWWMSKRTQIEISRDIGIPLHKATVVSESDTHGGFHGDGTTFIELNCSKADVLKEIKTAQGWKELPLSDSSRNLIYEFCHLPFPEVANGYYYFYDRHSGATDVYDDTKVTGRGSLNFTIAIYDSDTNMLYYSRVDT